MPSVQFSLSDLEKLFGRTVPRDKEGLNEIFAFIKGDIESIEGEEVSIEVKDSNRPDIWSIEGIARSLRYQFGTGRSRPIGLAGKSTLKVIIDKRVQQIRPFISTAIVRSLRASDQTLKGWIALQEKLDLTYGRRRKRASIGMYQADLVYSPLRYTVADPDNTRFAPLGRDTEESLREIVKNHPKGAEYGEIIARFDEWPILIDGKDQILSLPPVINSNDLGRITPETENVLVEVTGTDAETVHNTLKVMIASLAERGGRIYSCQESYPYGSPRRVVSPNLAPRLAKLRVSVINNLLGTSLSLAHATRLAERAGYRVKRATRDSMDLEIPCYRTDIMHEVDMIEDIAIAQDLNKLKPQWPRIWTVGDLAPETLDTERVGEIMIGLGFQEVLTYVLTSPEVVTQRMQTMDNELVSLLNPKMSTHTIMRNWLLPSLLEFLSSNTHVNYPQKIFEVGKTINQRKNGLEPIDERRRLSAVTIHAQAGFTEIRSVLDALARNMGKVLDVRQGEHPSFLLGRCGFVSLDRQEAGIIGEVHPGVLRTWGLNLPAAAFEITVSNQAPAQV